MVLVPAMGRGVLADDSVLSFGCRMVDYGSGPALDRYFDFVVGSSGDVAGTFDQDELEKDLAFFVSSALKYGYRVDSPPTVSGGLFGEQFTRGTLQDASDVVEGIVEDDLRIESASVVVEQTGSLDEVRVRITASTVAEVIELDEVVSAP